MGLRRDLHALLVAITPKVYFQPPENIKLEYPCIVYERDISQTDFADNYPYNRVKRYTVTAIDRDPDSQIPDDIGKLPMTTHSRFFTSDNLNHDVFSVYF